MKYVPNRKGRSKWTTYDQPLGKEDRHKFRVVPGMSALEVPKAKGKSPYSPYQTTPVKGPKGHNRAKSAGNVG